MKVVKINKGYRNGVVEHYLVLLDESYSENDINYLVEEWCENEPCGLSYGYTVIWHIVEDKELISNVIKDKMAVIEEKIQALKSEKTLMEKYLSSNTINVSKDISCKYGVDFDEYRLCSNCGNYHY